MHALRPIFVVGILLRAAFAVETEPPGQSAVLWRAASDPAALDLYYGPGGSADAPRGEFTFVKEDLNGTSSKLVVEDRQGIKWTVKLGPEARPETAASRLLWGAGYFANEDYFLPELTIAGLPAHLHRGAKLIGAGGTVRDVRLKRHLPGEKKLGNWAWSENQFSDTRELNGLRVLMALMNNWDMTDENNAVYEDSDGAQSERIFMVSDVGSTFGNGELSWPMRYCRGNLNSYRNSSFIANLTASAVAFRAPAGASLLFLATPHEFFAKAHLRRIARNIPRGDARWMGDVLGKLSDRQIQEAFRAAGYPPDQIAGFAAVVRARIRDLQSL
jgi:hypothetical protein